MVLVTDLPYTPIKWPMGPAFPPNPSVGGPPFFNTNVGLWFFWDGTRWLSCQLFTVQLVNAAAPTTGNASFAARNPFAGQFDVFPELVGVSSLNTTDPATNFFTHQLSAKDGAGSTDLGDAISGLDETQDEWVSQEAAIGVVVSSDVQAFVLASTETGTASVTITATLQLRVVGPPNP